MEIFYEEDYEDLEGDDFYSSDELDRELSADMITPEEEAFIRGYLEDI